MKNNQTKCNACGKSINLHDCHDLILYDRWIISNGKRGMNVRFHLYLCDDCAEEMEDFMVTLRKED